jgi:hypothetical protein
VQIQQQGQIGLLKPGGHLVDASEIQAMRIDQAQNFPAIAPQDLCQANLGGQVMQN